MRSVRGCVTLAFCHSGTLAFCHSVSVFILLPVALLPVRHARARAHTHTHTHCPLLTPIPPTVVQVDDWPPPPKPTRLQLDLVDFTKPSRKAPDAVFADVTWGQAWQVVRLPPFRASVQSRGCSPAACVCLSVPPRAAIEKRQQARVINRVGLAAGNKLGHHAAEAVRERLEVGVEV